MRDTYMGDSLDMSKRVAIALLREAGFSIVVCPLPSAVDFSDATYRLCLGLKEGEDVFNPEVRFRGAQRAKHLSVLRDYLANWESVKPSIAILDPDKGVRRVHGRRNKNLFITVEEVNNLAEIAKPHLVALYHHKNAGRISYGTLLGLFTPRTALAYDFGAAALCFVHSEAERLEMVREVLDAHLNPYRVLPDRSLQEAGPPPFRGKG